MFPEKWGSFRSNGVSGELAISREVSVDKVAAVSGVAHLMQLLLTAALIDEPGEAIRA
jgi:hypothetical protein